MAVTPDAEPLHGPKFAHLVRNPGHSGLHSWCLLPEKRRHHKDYFQSVQGVVVLAVVYRDADGVLGVLLQCCGVALRR